MELEADVRKQIGLFWIDRVCVAKLSPLVSFDNFTGYSVDYILEISKNVDVALIVSMTFVFQKYRMNVVKEPSYDDLTNFSTYKSNNKFGA